MKNENNLKKIILILDEWKKDLNDFSRIEKLRDAFMGAKTTSEVNEIIMANIQFIDRVGLWRLANRAKKRIINLNKVKMELTEKIYLN